MNTYAHIEGVTYPVHKVKLPRQARLPLSPIRQQPSGRRLSWVESEQRARYIFALRNAGYLQREIAEELKIDRGLVAHYLADGKAAFRAGVRRRPMADITIRTSDLGVRYAFHPNHA